MRGSESLKPTRGIYFALLMIPAFAIFGALLLIIVLAKFNVTPLVFAVGLVLLQYLGLVVYLWKRISKP